MSELLKAVEEMGTVEGHVKVAYPPIAGGRVGEALGDLAGVPIVGGPALALLSMAPAAVDNALTLRRMASEGRESFTKDELDRQQALATLAGVPLGLGMLNMERALGVPKALRYGFSAAAAAMPGVLAHYARKHKKGIFAAEGGQREGG